MLKQIYKETILCLTIITIAGCTMPYKTPVVVDKQARFMGIGEILKETNETVEVIIIHGMCTHDENWALNTNTHLAEILGSKQKFTKENNSHESCKKISDEDNSTVICSFTINVDDKQLQTHSILWSPVTTPEKQKLCYARKDKEGICKESREYPYKRAWLNSEFKDIILNDCLSDAVIYAGNMKNKIQNQIKNALLESLNKRSGNNNNEKFIENEKFKTNPLIFISESLGSKILFDILYEMRHGAMSEVVKQISERTIQMFMAANQIPILSLANDQAQENMLNILGAGYQAVRNQQTDISPLRQSDSLNVIAFTDPNDLLSYPLKNSESDDQKYYKLTDIIVSNDTTYLGLFENPLSAHKSYLSNPGVRQLMVCGYPESAMCQK